MTMYKKFLEKLSRKGLYSLIVLMLFFSAAFLQSQSAQAEANSTTKSKLRVGYYYLPGVNEMLDGKTPYGFAHEFLERLLLYGDWEYEYCGYRVGLQENFNMLERGEIDCIPYVTVTPERLKRFDYTKKFIGYGATNITCSSDETRFSKTPYYKIPGLRVGLLRASYRNAGFLKRAAELQMDYTPVYFETLEQMEEALKKTKKVDLLVTNSTRIIKDERVLDQYDFHVQNIIVRKGDIALRDKLDKQIEEMDKANPMWRRDMWNKYGAVNMGNHLGFTEEELNYLERFRAENSVLKVLTNPKRFPLSKLENGKYTGIVTDIFAEIAKRLQLKYEYIPVRDMEEYNKAWQNNEADIILDLYDDYNIPKQNQYMLTASYLDMDLAYLNRKAAEGHIKKVAGISLYQSSTKEKYNKLIPKGARVIEYSSSNECIEAVEKGQVDATIIYTFAAQQALNRDKRGVLSMQVIPNSSVGISIGVSKKHENYLGSIMQKSVLDVRETFIEKYLADHNKYSTETIGPTDFIYMYPVSSLAALCLALVIMFLTFYYYQRSKNLDTIAQQKQEIEDNFQIGKQLQQALKAGFWQVYYNEQGEVIKAEFSDEFMDILKLHDLDKLENPEAEWLRRIHPDDLQYAYAAYKKDIFGGKTNATYEHVYRVLDGENRYRWLKNVDRVICYPNGVPKMVIGSAIDATDEYYRDTVTGGLNRDGFINGLEGILADKAVRPDYCMLHFNIKNFKAFNAMWGFSNGDKLLQYFFELLSKSQLKPVAMGRKEDQFACLINKSTLLLEPLEELCIFDYQMDTSSVEIHAHCGIYKLTDEDIDITTMLDRAKLARRAIKDEYVKPYAIFTEDMKQQYIDTAFATGELKKALAEKQIKVYYQPIVDCQSGHIVSAEALVRWEHPERGMISPGIFIPIMEENGYISAIDLYVAQSVAALYKKRMAQNLPLVSVSVNLSWMDFYDQELLEWIQEDASQTDYPEDLLRCEITESSYAALSNNVTGVLEKFNELKIKLMLDDFGTGVSSLGVLYKYSFDIIKIDMSFTRRIGVDPKINSMLQAMIDMCHQIGLKVVAEGVETQEQLDFYRRNNCDYIQGFYFYKPMPEVEFEQLLATELSDTTIGQDKNKREPLPSSYYKAYLYFPSKEMHTLANQATQQILSLIGKNSGVGAISGLYDEKRSICFFSNLFAELLGYTNEEFVAYTEGSYLKIIAPEDIEAYLDEENSIRYYSLVDKEGKHHRVKELRSDVTNSKGERQWVASVRQTDNEVLQSLWPSFTLESNLLHNKIYSDGLTGVLNRNFYIDNAANLEATALAMLDVDNLKTVNDSYGHIAGDEALKAVAKVVMDSIRSRDIVIRYGGDEFIIVFKDVPKEALEKRLENIRQKIKDIVIKDYPDVKLSCSIGGIVTNRVAQDSLKKADELLYKAKQSKNTVIVNLD